MESSFFSVVFLAFFALVPVAIIAALVVRGIKSASSRSSLVRLAAEKGWTIHGAPPPSLLERLGPYFALRQGRHDLFRVIGATGAAEYLAEYRYRAPRSHREARSRSSILAIGSGTSGDSVLLVPRGDGALAAAAEGMAGSGLAPVPAEPWSWLLESPPGSFEGIAPDDSAAPVLKSLLPAGNSLVLAGGVLVLSAPGPLDRRRAGDLADRMERLSAILTRSTPG